MSLKKVVTPDQQRAAAEYLAERYKISQRRAGRVIGRSRSTLRYDRKHRSDEPPLVQEIKRLARRHPRYGYRRIHAMLDRSGWSVNLKRVHRLWIELGLKRPTRRKKPRKLGSKPGIGGYSCVQKPSRFKNDVWTCGFIHVPVEAGSPWQNGYIESFHSRLRDEFLERVEFESVPDARAKASWFRREYNTIRPDSSIEYKTPRELREECDQKHPVEGHSKSEVEHADNR
jgi:transposase InsO family protein